MGKIVELMRYGEAVDNLLNEMVYVKEYHSEGEFVVAICDAELLGRMLKESSTSFYIDPGFYGGRKITIGEALDLLEASTIANIVGEKIVNAAIKRNLVHRDAVIYIEGVPHAQIIKMI